MASPYFVFHASPQTTAPPLWQINQEYAPMKSSGPPSIRANRKRSSTDESQASQYSFQGNYSSQSNPLRQVSGSSSAAKRRRRLSEATVPVVNDVSPMTLSPPFPSRS